MLTGKNLLFIGKVFYDSFSAKCGMVSNKNNYVNNISQKAEKKTLILFSPRSSFQKWKSLTLLLFHTSVFPASFNSIRIRNLIVFQLWLQKDAVTNICQAADKQLITLVEWAKRIPHFVELPLEDQVILLRAGIPSTIIMSTIYNEQDKWEGQNWNKILFSIIKKLSN